jgi:hypothetical protein
VIKVDTPPPPPPPPPALAAPVPPPPAPLTGGVGWELAASGLALVSSDGAAGAGAAALGLGRRRSGPAGQVFFAGGSRRTVDLQGGMASYTRLVTGIEGSWRFPLARDWPLDAAVQALLGALLADGVGLPGARGSTVFDPGLGAQLRLGRRLGPTVLQLSVGLWAWPRVQTLVVVGAVGQGTTRDLPRVEGVFSLGLAFGTR